MESEVRHTRANEPAASAGDVDPRLLSFRNWALQSDLTAVLDESFELSRPADLGLTSSASSGEPGGQGELARELEPDPERKQRTLYMLLLWSTALVTIAFNQFSPFGLSMSETAFWVLITGILVAIAVVAVGFPRLRGRGFSALEQAVVAFAFPLIAYQCHDTGGARSPYVIWWLYAAFYAAHFFPPRRVYLNAALITAGALVPFTYQGADADSVAATSLLVVLIWALCGSIAGCRELERGAERAARYTALADPLTGVANQRAIERVIDTATRGGQPQFGLVLVDMHGLKGSNAAFGFKVGDAMLIRLVGLMRHASEAGDQVARIRGEEFAVYLPGAGSEEVAAWRERFDRIVTEHNAWVRSRQPQISVTVASAVYPIDGTRASQLFELAGRKLTVERSGQVLQPHEVTVSTVPGADRLIARAAVAPEPRLRGFVGATRQLGARWAFGALVFGLYAASSGAALRYPGGMAAVAALCLTLSVACFALKATRLDRPVARISDVTSVLLILPILWSSSGWESPLVLTIFYPTVYYGQFLRGRRAYLRTAMLLGCFSVAFWGGGALGVADTPVGPAGETIFATIIVALTVLTVVLQSSHKVAAAALGNVLEAATRDPLTGLPNVHALRDDLQAMVSVAADEPSAEAPVSASGPVPRPAVTIADIDDFRGLIYRHGHKQADSVLLAVSARLVAALGGMARAYHIERDEFAVLFKAESHDVAVEMTERVEQAILEDPERHPRIELPVRFSFGTSIWSSGASVESMVDEAAEMLAAGRAERGGGDTDGGTGGRAVLL